MKTRDIPPFAPVLMESTRAIGYNLETAVADIVDNSLSANSSLVDVFFTPYESPYIAILDNGNGMTDDEIDDAMRYGSQSSLNDRRSGDLGRFGLGMKTSSLSQCRCLTVVSKQKDCISGRRWDIDEVIQSNSWSLLILETEDYETVPHFDELLSHENGTLIVWQKLDRMFQGVSSAERSMNIQMDNVRNHLELVFHRYISGEKGIIKNIIRMNGLEIIAKDPFLETKSTQIQDDEHFSIEGHTVTVSCYVLPHTSKMTSEDLARIGGQEGLIKNQGFYVYRNKRLLVWGTWFRLQRKDSLSKLARVRVDITNELDDLWSLDVKKSTAVPPEIIRENLKRVVERITSGSRKTWTFRGKREISDEKVHVWNRVRTREGIEYRLNRDHPLASYLKKEFNEEQNIIYENYLKLAEQYFPVNQIYSDLNDDVQINTIDAEEYLIKNLMTLFENIRKVPEKRILLETLKISHPYSESKKAIEMISQEIRNECRT